MRLAFFVPCYIDQLFPDVALAALELLEQLGDEVWVPDTVSCCGQPLINTGAVSAAAPLARGFEEMLAQTDYVICPSASCVATLRQHARRYSLDPNGFQGRIYELTEFLAERLDVTALGLKFPYRVALHQSCHGLRDLGLGSMSEISGEPPRHSPARRMLSRIEGLSLVELQRPDECCGFGGSFCIGEPEVSASMGSDRISDFQAAGAEVVTSVDMSCLMHLSGLISRQERALSVMHVAQILAGRPLPEPAGAAAG
jgi:L-lactate dehydrogenase complex protein LldE